MEEFFATNRKNWDDRVPIHVRDATGFYGVEDFLAGRDSLHDLEAQEIGDVAGKRLIHLQCHFGLDTLSLARRGARASGLDFSGAAIDAARTLAQRAGLEADFVIGNVYDARRHLDGAFDIVFVTWGALSWLPDVRGWASVVASLLAPSGFLYLAELHPSAAVLEPIDGKLVLTWDWRTPAHEPLRFSETATYSGDSTPLAHPRTCEWIHPLSDVISALIAEGLVLEMFREHERVPWMAFPFMVEAGDGFWRLPDGMPRMPLAYSLRARKR